MFMVKCDLCGVTQVAPTNEMGKPHNPINPKTGEKWWSRTKTKDRKTKVLHACSRKCMELEGTTAFPL